MHSPYLLLMTPSVLYGACVRMSNKFSMSSHPGGPGRSTAVDVQQCDTAVSHYSTVLSFHPHSSQSILIKRSKAFGFGIVEITTTQDLSRLNFLILVYPWIDFLLD